MQFIKFGFSGFFLILIQIVWMLFVNLIGNNNQSKHYLLFFILITICIFYIIIHLLKYK